MKELVFYGLVIGFLFGVTLRSTLEVENSVLLLLAILTTAIGVVFLKNRGLTSARYLLCVCVCVGGLLFGIIRMDLALEREEAELFPTMVGEEVELLGVVVREPEYREKSTHLYVESEHEILLLTTSRFHDARYGDQVHFTGTLKRPEPFETDLGRTFDYAGYLEARGVRYMISYAEVEVRESHQANFVIERLLSFKSKFIEKLEAVLPAPHSGLSVGLLLGVKGSLGEAYESIFRKTGITHIVVLSGYNIMLVSVFVMYVLSFFLPRKIKLAFGFGAIILFAILVGLGASVVRASVMAGLMLLAQFSGRTYDVLRALIVALVLMLMWNPYLLLHDIGFQFSFLATLGLILFSPHLGRLFKNVPKVFGVREFLTATVAAQLFVTPLLLYHIGTFSSVSVLVNVLVLPMVPVAMLLSFVTGLAAFLSPQLASLFGYAAYLSLSYILEVAAFFAGFPFASFAVPSFPFVYVLLAYGALTAFLWYLTFKKEVSPVKGWTIVEESVWKASLTKENLPVYFK
jgi:competence protein ComEC